MDATSEEVELNLRLPLREGMLLAKARVGLVSCDIELGRRVAPAEGEALDPSLDALCCTNAARNENLGEESRPRPPPLAPVRGCAGLRLGDVDGGCADMMSDMIVRVFRLSFDRTSQGDVVE